MWDKSKNVMHLRYHKEEYEKLVDNFIANCLKSFNQKDLKKFMNMKLGKYMISSANKTYAAVTIYNTEAYILEITSLDINS